MVSIFDNSLIYFVIIIAILFQALYLYLTRNSNYWSKRGVKGPRPIPFFGTILYEFLTGKHILELRWIAKYGKVYGVFEGATPFLRVADPELIKDILVRDFHIFHDRDPLPERHLLFKTRNLVVATGDDWRRMRSIVTPTFTSFKLKKMYPQFKTALHDFVHALDGYANSGKDVDMKQMYSCLSLDVVARCAFATQINVYDDPHNAFRVKAEKTFIQKNYRILMSYIAPVFLLKLIHSTDKNTAFFHNIVRKVIAERKSGTNEYNDFVDMVLKREINGNYKRDVNGVKEAHDVNEGEDGLEVETKTLADKDRYLTEEEIIASAHVFLLAGWETTATTLTHCTHELATNPQIQERLYEEVMTAVDSKGDMDYDAVTRLPFMDAVISETLRLHSPAFSVRRCAGTDYKLGNTGITVQKGIKVEIPVYGIHLQEEFYSQPLKFIPDRFMPENRHKLIPYTFIPFGAGPRNCVGLMFASLEAKLAVAQLVRHYKLVQTSATDVPVLHINTVIMNTAERVVIGLVKRM